MTYWENKGRYQAKADALRERVPVFGSATNAKTSNKHLEKFRKASNCYYDLYNNGLGNRAREFSTLFRIPGVPREIKQNYRTNFLVSSMTEGAIENKMDGFILDAYREQVALGKLQPVNMEVV